MQKYSYTTELGDIVYWTNDMRIERPTLVFLPGLTADHRLFERQVEAFDTDYNLLVWDAPGHGQSRPFVLEFSLEDKARWLHAILESEGLFWAKHEAKPQIILIGQSMGGYVTQMYAELYPDDLSGLIMIDSASLKSEYTSRMVVWMLRHMEGAYRCFPWQQLLKEGAKGCAQTPYGRALMKDMMMDYAKDEYCRLVGHGYRILADAIADNRLYQWPCPGLLICGEQDKAGATLQYNKKMVMREQLPIRWIAEAGHNSNSDQPELVNHHIRLFIDQITHP